MASENPRLESKRQSPAWKGKRNSESVRAPRAARSTTRGCSHTCLCCSRLSNAQCSRKKVEFRPHIPCACLSTYFVDGYVDSTFFVFSSEGLSASCLLSWDKGHLDGDWAYAMGYGGFRYPCWRRTGTLHIAGADTISYFCLLSSFPSSPFCFYRFAFDQSVGFVRLVFLHRRFTFLASAGRGSCTNRQI